jgi:hypothetical protein
MSEISKQALKVDNSTSFPNNTTGYISPTILRAFNVNMIDSLVDEIGYTADSASWNVSIGNLNTYTASFAPSLTQLNAFTASQLTINSGYNSFTQSANQELDSLSAWTGSWELWTSSINEIRDNGVLQGYSTRFYFGGLVSASIVQNVNGPIASIDILQDGTKLNTSSFNDYTASTAATQLVFSASVATSISQSSNAFNTFSASQNSFNLSATASIVELLNLSSSLSGGYATQGELDQSSSVLQANINQKLFTSSFNDYTQSTAASQSVFSASVATQFSQSYAYINTYTASTNIRLNNLEATSASLSIETANLELFSASQLLLNPTLATTGSNVFTGSQTITGSVYGNIVSMSIASQTASMDLTVGNFFTLTLVSGSTTHLTATNIRPGQTVNLLVNQPSVGTGSVSYNSTFDFPAGNAYIATAFTSSKDILTFITFDSSIIYATSINNLV